PVALITPWRESAACSSAAGVVNLTGPVTSLVVHCSWSCRSWSRFLQVTNSTLPAGPRGPLAPLAPVAPCGPVAPLAPLAPLVPAGPWEPVPPAGPAGPAGPGGPAGPLFCGITVIAELVATAVS